MPCASRSSSPARATAAAAAPRRACPTRPAGRSSLPRLFRFCPWCSAPLGPLVGERQDCPGCGEPSYLNPKPTAGAILLDRDGRVLLARRGVEPFLGFWDLPGGFVAPGETLAEAVGRELREEAGVEVEVVRLVAAVPDVYGDGGDPTINAFFECRLTGGDPQPDDDVAELRWFDPDALPRPEELAFDCVRTALAAWRAGAY